MAGLLMIGNEEVVIVIPPWIVVSVTGRQSGAGLFKFGAQEYGATNNDYCCAVLYTKVLGYKACCSGRGWFAI